MLEKTRKYLDSLSKEKLIETIIALGFHAITDCEHKWKYIGVNGYGSGLYEIFCPKCNNTKLVDIQELKNIKKIQKIKKEWSK